MSGSSSPRGSPSGSASSRASTSSEDETRKLLRIGAGSFATVYVLGGRQYRALKQVADVKRCPELKQEYDKLLELYSRCNLKPPKEKRDTAWFRLPKPYSFYNSWEEYAQSKRLTGVVEPAQCVYTMSRVWGVENVLRQKIMEEYFPEEQRALCANKDFIARLYFGRPEQTRSASKFFNHMNFPLHTSRMLKLGLPVNDLAAGMGRMLSRIHHSAGYDGRDIEFVVGGSADEETTYWCMDFNQMRRITEGAKQLFDSFVSNDPYYPRPGTDYWEDFKLAYLAETPPASQDLAQQFIAKLVEKWPEMSEVKQEG